MLVLVVLALSLGPARAAFPPLSSPSGVAVFSTYIGTDVSLSVFCANTGGDDVLANRVLGGAQFGPLQYTGFKAPHGIAVDGRANLYVADTGHSRVVVLSNNGSLIAVLSRGLRQPRAVAVDNAGLVYVADTNNDTLATFPPVTLDLYGPHGLAVYRKTGDVYVADSGNNRIVIVSPDGNQLVKPIAVLCFLPYGVAADSEGNIIVADTYHYELYKYSPNGTFMYGTQAFTTPSGSDPVGSIQGVAVDSQDNIYIGSAESDAVVKFSPTFQQLLYVNLTIVLGSSFAARPAKIAVDSSFNIYVTAINSVVKLSSSGQLLLSFGDPSNSLWVAPSGIAVDSRGYIYATCFLTNSLFVFSNASAELKVITAGLNYPYDVALDAANNIYIANTGKSAIVVIPALNFD